MIAKENSVIPLELHITDLFGQSRTDIVSVSVRIYHRVDGTIVQDLESTAMIGSESLWHYSYASSLVAGEYIIEYTIIDAQDEVFIQLENLTVGYLESEIETVKTDVEFIKNVESGQWEIVNNQMIFYSSTGTELQRFNLFDAEDNPSMANIFKRVKV